MTRQDSTAFGEFYRRHVDWVLGYFLAATGDLQVSADLTAETFAAAFEGVERYDPDKGEPRWWLGGITRNLLMKHWRTMKSQRGTRERLGLVTPELPTGGWGRIEEVEAGLDRERLMDALDQLPTRYRQAVRLRILDGADYATIAHALGCSRGNARILVMRGLRKVRVAFDTGRPRSPGTQ